MCSCCKLKEQLVFAIGWWVCSLIHRGEDVSWLRLRFACSSADHRHPYQVRFSPTNDWKGLRKGKSSLTGSLCRQENATYGPNLTGLGRSWVHEQGIECFPMEFTYSLSGEQYTRVSYFLHLFIDQALKPQDDDTSQCTHTTTTVKQGILK